MRRCGCNSPYRASLGAHFVLACCKQAVGFLPPGTSRIRSKPIKSLVEDGLGSDLGRRAWDETCQDTAQEHGRNHPSNERPFEPMDAVFRAAGLAL